MGGGGGAWGIPHGRGELSLFSPQCPLYLCPELDAFEGDNQALELGLAGAHQRSNAALALQLARTWLQLRGCRGKVGGRGRGRQTPLCPPGSQQGACPPRSRGTEGGAIRHRAGGEAGAAGAHLSTHRCHDPRCSMAVPGCPPLPLLSCCRARRGDTTPGPWPVLPVLEGTAWLPTPHLIPAGVPVLEGHLGVPAMPCAPPLAPRPAGHGVAGPDPGAAPRPRDVVPGRGSHHQQHPGLRPLVPPGCPQPGQAP